MCSVQRTIYYYQRSCWLGEVSDIPGDPESQLPYQEFSPCCLAPIWLEYFPFPWSRWTVECPLSLISVLPSPLHNEALVGAHLFLTSSYSSYTHGRDITVFFCDIAISSVLNRFVQLDAPFAIIFFYSNGFVEFPVASLWLHAIKRAQ